MSISDSYRKSAARERLLAAKTDLPNRRAMYERSAAIWDEMALNAEATADRASVNAAAKVTA